jgi:hypothetical protein
MLREITTYSLSLIDMLLVVSLMIYLLAGTHSTLAQECVVAGGFILAHSSWWPQIWRNFQRGTCKVFQKRFMIGMTLCRLFYPLYLFACPANLVYHRASVWIWGLVAYTGLQLLVLFVQDYCGPRSLVPECVSVWVWSADSRVRVAHCHVPPHCLLVIRPNDVLCKCAHALLTCPLLELARYAIGFCRLSTITMQLFLNRMMLKPPHQMNRVIVVFVCFRWMPLAVLQDATTC